MYPRQVDGARYAILGHDGDGQPLDIAWRTPHMPDFNATVFLPDRRADPDHPWRAMIVTGIGHYPNRTEVVLAPAEEISTERLVSVFEQASTYAAQVFSD